MNTHEVAQNIKDHLVNLAVNDKLPLDMNELDIYPIIQILDEGEGETAFGFSVEDVVEKAMEDDYTITNDQAAEILGRMRNKGDLGVGISWDTVSYFIREFCENNNIQEDEAEEEVP